MLNATVGRRTRTVTIYGRVSLLGPGEHARSVDDQIRDLQSWADREGWSVYAVRRDDGISASRYAKGKVRPGWRSVREDIRSGEIDAVLFWDFARGSRDDAETALLKAECADRGVLLGYGGMLRDPASADGAFSIGLDGLMAAKFSAELSEKRRRAAESLAAEGRPPGSVPYGYRRVIDPNTGRTIGRDKHPEQAPVVEEIARRLLTREPAKRIAEDLTSRGLLTGTGKAWRGGNLRILVVRPTYAGLRVHHGEVLEGVRGTWPAILSEAQHHELVAMFADPARDKFRNPTYAKHLGTGIFRCGRQGCDGRMRVFTGHNGALVQPRPSAYACRECHKVSRNQERVDEHVSAAVCAWLARPDVLTLLGQVDDPTVATASAEVTRLKRKLREARQAWDDDKLSLADYTDMKARTDPKIKAAEAKARPRNLPAALFKVTSANGRTREAWDALSIGDRRAVVAAVVDVVILPNPRRGVRRPIDETVQITPKGVSTKAK